MITREVLKINESYRWWLTQTGLISFEQLMFGDVGCLIAKSRNYEIRRIEAGGRAAYLKRRFNTSIRKSIERYLQGKYAHTVCFDEYIHICELQKLQLPVMNPIASGERRTSGFPQCGFFLTEEVKGVNLSKALEQAGTENEKTKLLQSYGQMLARLHYHGFYAVLRLKDVIVTEKNPISLVIIDREAWHCYPRRRSKIKAKRSLNKSFSRTKIETAIDEYQINVIMDSYRCYCAG